MTCDGISSGDEIVALDTMEFSQSWELGSSDIVDGRGDPISRHKGSKILRTIEYQYQVIYMR